MGCPAADYLDEVLTTEVNSGLALFSVFPGLCKGCGLCKEKCPEGALSWSKDLGVYGTPTIVPDPDLCKACRICENVCPDCAIVITKLDQKI